MIARPSKQQLLRLLPAGWVQVSAPRDGEALYLSFDDGPHPEHTPRLLDLLAAHDARASFFVVGQHAEAQPAIVERIVGEGHLLGNHSWNHRQFGRLSLREQVEEVDRTDRLLQAFDGQARHRFRPPQGAVNIPLLLHMRRQRRSIAFWSYDSFDWRVKTGAALVERLRNEPPQAGDIVLMHDDAALAFDALGEMLPHWAASGARFRALPPERT